MIVAPERDVPGISAKHWAKPTFNASRQVMSSTAATRAGRSLRSTQRITSAPAMNAAATGTAAKRCALMKLPKRSPSTAAGMKATTRFATNRCAARSEPSPASTPRNFARYSQTIASIAPVWIAMSNVFAFSSLKPRRSPARMRWPVLETGRNSVRPSTTPSTRALRSSAVSIAAGILPARRGDARAVTARLSQSHHEPLDEDRPLLRAHRLELLGGAAERLHERRLHRRRGLDPEPESRRPRSGALGCPPACCARGPRRGRQFPVSHFRDGLGPLAGSRVYRALHLCVPRPLAHPGGWAGLAGGAGRAPALFRIRAWRARPPPARCAGRLDPVPPGAARARWACSGRLAATPAARPIGGGGRNLPGSDRSPTPRPAALRCLARRDALHLAPARRMGALSRGDCHAATAERNGGESGVGTDRPVSGLRQRAEAEAGQKERTKIGERPTAGALALGRNRPTVGGEHPARQGRNTPRPGKQLSRDVEFGPFVETDVFRSVHRMRGPFVACSLYNAFDACVADESRLRPDK